MPHKVQYWHMSCVIFNTLLPLFLSCAPSHSFFSASSSTLFSLFPATPPNPAPLPPPGFIFLPCFILHYFDCRVNLLLIVDLTDSIALFSLQLVTKLMLRVMITGTLLAVVIGFSTVNTIVLIVTILTIKFY